MREFAALVAFGVLSACSSTEVDLAQAGSSEENPRFATPEQLVEYVGSITRPDAHNARAYLSLVYSESEAQRLWFQFCEEYVLPGAELNEAMKDHYGEGYLEDARANYFWVTTNLHLTRQDGPRAEAEYNSSVDTVETMYLVKIGAGWWVSGFTWEYHPKFDPTKFMDIARNCGGLRSYIEEVTERVRSGEITSVKKARQAHDDAIARHARDKGL